MKIKTQTSSLQTLSLLLVGTCFTSSSSFNSLFVSAEGLCPSLTTFETQAYELDQALNLSIVGFKASITYVSAPENTTPVLTITAASEDPIVELTDSGLTITADTCTANVPVTSDSPTAADVVVSSDSPSASPSDPSDPSSANMMMIPGLSLMSLFLSSNSYAAPFVSAGAMMLLSLLPAAVAQDDDLSCTPTIELEIGVPYSCPFDNFVDGVCLTPTEIADLTVQALFVDFDVEAASALLADDYIQHNPGVPTGAAPVLGFLPALEASGLAIETHRTLAQGNLVAYHSTYTNATLFGGETLIGFDVFRVENGKVQEHWDNLQELAGPNPNGNTMVDGPTMIKYLSQTEANKETALALVNGVLVGGDPSLAPVYISSEEYTQHNPGLADGLDGLAAGLAVLAEQNMLFAYDNVELVIAEGNFVMTGSPGEFGPGNPTAFYDLFRIEDGLIVEHWDVIQAIPSDEEFAHENGKF